MRTVSLFQSGNMSVDSKLMEKSNFKSLMKGLKSQNIIETSQFMLNF